MRQKRHLPVLLLIVSFLALSCTNSPYRSGKTAEPVWYGSFGTPLTKLDPTSAYYVHEGQIIDQIYEPPFTYHYLKRPYELMPLTAAAIPEPAYFDKNGERLAEADPDPDRVGRVEYTIRIKPGIMYQDHPCFAVRDDGSPFYNNHTPLSGIEEYEYPSEFEHQGTRELRAADYALQIRRLADPRLASPILSTMERYILGMDTLQAAYQETLESERSRRKAAAGTAYDQERNEKDDPILLDYMGAELPGVEVIDSHTFKIVLKLKYPQILYWMCMHFFAPMPAEAVAFYSIPAVAQKEFSINNSPVGTGPYYLKEFQRNEKMVLEQNPNYHEDHYPVEASVADREAGLLADAGKRLPFIRRQIWILEKEHIPSWNKFLQGYYDSSGIASDVFDQAIALRTGEDPGLSDVMREKGIKLVTDVDTTFWYTAFNMLDDVVGYTNRTGSVDEKKCKLRQAISIALDYNEYLDIFANGRGILAQGPIPPGIFGYRGGEAGTNPFVDEWDPGRQRHVRKDIAAARKLLEEAGYPDGVGPDGKPLTLHYDHSAQGDASFRSYFDWVRQRFELLGVRIKDRGTDLSRYRQKTKEGNWQLASGGWLADYPDPENFLFLFYGPNGKVKTGGANAMNYENAEYDELFRQMESMQNSDKRQELIDRMMRMLQRDAPAVWQYHPVSYGLQHEWYRNVKPHQMSYNTMKYKRIDAELRARRQMEWNKPLWQPVAGLLALLALGTVPAAIAIRRREEEPLAGQRM